MLGPSVSLAAIGTAGTAVIAGITASWLFHFSIAEGLLLGAILSPTDGAVMLVLVMVEVIRVPGYGPIDAVWYVPRSLEFFNLVFFAVLVSTLIQGATVELLAHRLGMSSADTA